MIIAKAPFAKTTASTPSSSSQQIMNANQKAGMDIYTVMLLLSMVCMLIAVIAMYIEYGRYGDDGYNTTGAVSAVMQTAKAMLA